MLSIVLFAVLGLLYLNKVGLPGFLKSRIIAQLETQGLNLEFSRLRLAGFREVRIENVSFGAGSAKENPRLFIDSAKLNLSWEQFRKGRLGVTGLQIKRGRFLWPLLGPDGSRAVARLDDIVTELMFAPEDRWELINFRADFLGAKIRLIGSIENASAIRDWGGPSTNQAGNSWEPFLQNFLNTMQRLEYPSPPELTLRIAGDAKDLSSFKARLHLIAPLAITPWGKIRRLDLDSRVEPTPGAPGQVEANLLLQFDELKTPSGTLENATAKSHTFYAYTNAPVVQSEWNFYVKKATNMAGFAEGLSLEFKTSRQTNEPNTHVTVLDARAGQLSLSGISVNEPSLRASVVTRLPDVEFFSGISSLWSANWMTNVALVKRGEYAAQAAKVRMNGAQPEKLRITGTFYPSGGGIAFTDFASVANAFVTDFHADLSDLGIHEIPVDTLNSVGRWVYPELRLEKVNANVFGEAFTGAANLNVSNSFLWASLNSNFDLRKAKALAPASIRQWLDEIDWIKSPEINLSGTTHLEPPNQPDWWTRFRADLQLAGDFKLSEFAVKKTPFRAGQGHFTWSNTKLEASAVHLVLPEGGLTLSYSENTLSNQFTFNIKSTANPKVLHNFLDGDAQFAVDQFVFRTPPSISAEGGGSWEHLESVYFHGSATATNFVFRDEEWKSFEGAFRYTNLFISLDQITIRQGDGTIAIPSAGFDFRLMLGYVTNAFSTVDPSPVVKVMGPIVSAAVAPYHFSKPPKVLINGTVPTIDPSKADLYFQVNGGPFNYWRFNVPEISGDIHWRGDFLTISNVQAPFYNGHLDWQGDFRFKLDDSADFQFKAAVQGADLKLAMLDLIKSTNRLEGTLKGNLVITAANSDDWKSWQGFGDGQLEHGFLWKVPIFGVFSPLLNSIAPGLGDNPASAASATFTIDKSVIYTRDLEVRSPALRLRYLGQVDFDGNLNAHMRAEFLRDAWVIGKVFSIAFWPITKAFEYKVTGTLEDPKSKPLYIPKLILFPFHPVQTLKDVFSRHPIEGGETNVIQNEISPK